MKNRRDSIDVLDLNEDKPVRRRPNKSYVRVTYFVMFLLLAMSAYFCYFLGFESEDFINNSYNSRLTALSSKVIRGDIVSEDGEVLATTKQNENGKEYRVYPKGRMYAHAVGFVSNGMQGLEKDKNFYLLRSHTFILNRLAKEVMNEKNMGDTLVSTINSKLQETAYYAMDGFKGAIVAMDPKTGEIKCMVSRGDFDPNEIEDNWADLTEDSESSVLINRATQGLYPPGSTFKILPALEYIREGGHTDDPFNCEGSYSYNGHTIRCYHDVVHGAISFIEAFAKSCNSTFAEIAPELDKKSFSKLADKLLFNKPLPTDLSNVSTSRFEIASDTPDALMMQTTIGQGNTLVTPIHMLMIVSAICNDGDMVEPRLAGEMQNSDGAHVSDFKSKTYGSVFSKNEANLLKDFMREVVTSGTATALNNDSYTAYGKTGSAEFKADTNDSHSWFVGFATQGDKNLAIAVIMEGAGSGSEYAVPAAREVFDVFFNN